MKEGSRTTHQARSVRIPGKRMGPSAAAHLKQRASPKDRSHIGQCQKIVQVED